MKYMIGLVAKLLICPTNDVYFGKIILYDHKITTNISFTCNSYDTYIYT